MADGPRSKLRLHSEIDQDVINRTNHSKAVWVFSSIPEGAAEGMLNGVAACQIGDQTHGVANPPVRGGSDQ
jgi:hypothetical protein